MTCHRLVYKKQTKVLSDIGTTKEKRGKYEMYSPKRKLMLVNYTVLHGTSTAMEHFKLKHPG